MATTIHVEVSTRDELKSLCHKGETYDSVIKRLLRSNQYVGFMDKQNSILGDAKGWRKLTDIP